MLSLTGSRSLKPHHGSSSKWYAANHSADNLSRVRLVEHLHLYHSVRAVTMLRKLRSGCLVDGQDALVNLPCLHESEQ